MKERAKMNNNEKAVDLRKWENASIEVGCQKRLRLNAEELRKRHSKDCSEKF